MIQSYIVPILWVTGAITASMALQFVAPRPILRIFTGLDVDDEVTLFYARAAGLMISLYGVLLIWAASDPAIRTAVLTATAIGKAGFVGLILTRIRGFARGYTIVVVFDTACVAVFVAYLLGA